jgi:hypothetical protein
MKYANHTIGTDILPFEVIREVNAKTLDIREMRAALDPAFKPEFSIGGFAGHCINSDQQRYLYDSDDTAPIVRIRLHKTGSWRDKHGNRYYLSNEPKRYRDYNY